MDEAVDGGLDFGRGFVRGRTTGGQQGLELCAPALQHLRDPVENLAPVVGGARGPARLAARAAVTASRTSLREQRQMFAIGVPSGASARSKRPDSERGNLPPT